MRLIHHPVLCNYYLTYRCNAKCSFCDIWERPSPFAELKTASQNLHALKKLGVKVVDFTGGEPLLHPKIDGLLAEAKKLGFITTLTTNGVRYPFFAKRLQGKVDMLHFSLDSSDAKEHDRIRGIACFEKVMESIQIAKDVGERPDILFTVWDENVHHIEKIWKNICLPNNLLLILNPIFDYNEVDTMNGLSPKTLKHLLFWSKKRNVYLNQGFIALRKDGGNHIKSPVCKAGSSTIVISPDNKLIVPCYHLEKGSFEIKNNLFELYKSKEVQSIIAKEGRFPECEGCVINCYMQPSFAVNMNKYWWKALGSTLKYNRMKGTWKQLF